MKWIIVVASLALDRLLKTFAMSGVLEVSRNESLFLLSLDQDWLVWLSGLIIAALMVQFIREIKTQAGVVLVGYLLIMVGGLSNLFDRLTYGYVVDMIRFFDISVFNLADVMIMIGCGLIMLKILRTRDKLG